MTKTFKKGYAVSFNRVTTIIQQVADDLIILVPQGGSKHSSSPAFNINSINPARITSEELTNLGFDKKRVSENFEIFRDAYGCLIVYSIESKKVILLKNDKAMGYILYIHELQHSYEKLTGHHLRYFVSRCACK